MAKQTKRILSLAVFAGMLLAPAVGFAADDKPAAAPAAPASVATVVLESSTWGDGAPLAYPKGTPLVTSRHVLFPPGSATPMHRHGVPLFAYMLEGELVITTEGQEPRRYKAGDAFMETSGWHVGRNETDKPARLLSVYMGEVGAPLSERKK